MNKQQLDERIADIPNECFEAYPAGYYNYAEHAKMVKQLISDVLDEVVPEPRDINHANDTIVDIRAGYNTAITTITDKRRELGL